MRGLMSSTTDPCYCTAPLSAVQRRELNLMRNFAVSFGLLSMLTGLGGFYYYGFTCECMHLGMGGCMRGGQNCATDCPAPPPRSQLGSAGRPRATLSPLSSILRINLGILPACRWRPRRGDLGLGEHGSSLCMHSACMHAAGAQPHISCCLWWCPDINRAALPVMSCCRCSSVSHTKQPLWALPPDVTRAHSQRCCLILSSSLLLGRPPPAVSR